MKRIIWALIGIGIIICFIVGCWTSYNIGIETGQENGINAGMNYVGYNLCALNKTFDCDNKICGCFSITTNNGVMENGTK